MTVVVVCLENSVDLNILTENENISQCQLCTASPKPPYARGISILPPSIKLHKDEMLILLDRIGFITLSELL